MSFYAPRKHMGQFGFVWLAPVMEFVGGAMKSQPVDTRNPYAASQSPNTALTVAAVVGGLAVVGTLGYLLVKR